MGDVRGNGSAGVESAARSPAAICDPEHGVPLKADFTRALPGGKLDDATYEAIETALDRAGAPCRAAGRWLTLHERVEALAAPEMLEALKAAKRGAEYPDELGDIINDAITKAEGEG